MTPSTISRTVVPGARRLRLSIAAVVLILAVLVASGMGLYWLMNARSFQLIGDIVSYVSTPEPVVALTFDDGPVAGRVDTILGTLRQANVRATFYVIGEPLAASPESGR